MRSLPMARSSAAALALCLFADGAASAAVPAPPNCTIDIAIVGSASTIPITVGGGCYTTQPGFRVAVRDINNVPIGGASVVLDYSGTAIRLFSPQGQAGTTVNCAARTITRLANAAGVAVIVPMFGGSADGNSVLVLADGVILAAVPARSTDIDAGGGETGLPDFLRFSAAFQSLTPSASMNFDNCPVGMSVLDLADFAIFTTQFNSGASGAYCP